MTEIEALKAHIRLWNWMRTNSKSSWPEWEHPGNKGAIGNVTWNGIELPNDCFLCYYHLQADECVGCPLGSCTVNSLYGKYKYTYLHMEGWRSETAKLIRDAAIPRLVQLIKEKHHGSIQKD